MNKKVLLMILDGWGIAKNLKVSAIDHAKTPYINSLYKKYPHSKLEASGLAVGLPAHTYWDLGTSNSVEILIDCDLVIL